MSKRRNFIISYTDLDGEPQVTTTTCSDAAGALGWLLDMVDDVDEGEPIALEPKKRKRRKPKPKKASGAGTVLTFDPVDRALMEMRAERKKRLGRAK